MQCKINDDQDLKKYSDEVMDDIQNNIDTEKQHFEDKIALCRLVEAHPCDCDVQIDSDKLGIGENRRRC